MSREEGLRRAADYLSATPEHVHDDATIERNAYRGLMRLFKDDDTDPITRISMYVGVSLLLRGRAVDDLADELIDSALVSYAGHELVYDLLAADAEEVRASQAAVLDDLLVSDEAVREAYQRGLSDARHMCTVSCAKRIRYELTSQLGRLLADGSSVDLSRY